MDKDEKLLEPEPVYCDHQWMPSGNGPRCSRCGTYEEQDEPGPILDDNN